MALRQRHAKHETELATTRIFIVKVHVLQHIPLITIM